MLNPIIEFFNFFLNFVKRFNIFVVIYNTEKKVEKNKEVKL